MLKPAEIRAMCFAKRAHGQQKQGRRPYWHHLQEVRNVLMEFGYASPLLLQGAWLHDVLEDTAISLAELSDAFGLEVAMLVWSVTDGEGDTRAERKQSAYAKMAYSGEQACLLKLADRLANVRFSASEASPYLQMYQDEQHAFFSALYCYTQASPMWGELCELTYYELP